MEPGLALGFTDIVDIDPDPHFCLDDTHTVVHCLQAQGLVVENI